MLIILFLLASSEDLHQHLEKGGRWNNYPLSPPNFCWILCWIWGRGEGGGSEILARDHLLVGRPMPTQDDFRRTGMSEFLGGEGLRYLAHTWVFLKSRGGGWDLQMSPCPLIGARKVVKKSEPDACHEVTGMWFEGMSWQSLLYRWAIGGASGSTEPKRCWVTGRTACIYGATIISAVDPWEVGVNQHQNREGWHISVEASHDVGWYLDLPGWQALSVTDDLPTSLGGWEKSFWEFSFPLKGDKKKREWGELSIQWNKLPP